MGDRAETHIALHRLGNGGGGRELPELSVMGIIPLPERTHGGQHLLHVAPGVGLFEPGLHAVKFALIGARANAELQPPAADQIQERSLTGQIDRVPVGGGGHGGAEADLAGLARPPGQDLEGVGGNRHLDGMVFGGPDNIKPARLGHLHHVQRVPRHVVHIKAVVDPLQIDRELEFHMLAPCLSGPVHRITNGFAIGASEVFIQTVLGLV